MKILDLLTTLKNSDGLAIEKIAQIDDDVIGTSIFINILLAVGAFFATAFILAFVASFGLFTVSEETIWIYAGIIAIVMVVLGHFTYSSTSLFMLRFSSFFMIFGKIALTVLILERIGFFIGYENLWNNIRYFVPIVLTLAFVNIYIGKTKLEIFFVLFCGFFMMHFLFNELLYYSAIGNNSFFLYEATFIALVTIFVALLLVKFDKNYLYRLPAYAFIAAYIFVMLVVTFNLIETEISVPIYTKNWALLIFPSIEGLYITIFCLIYGYVYRDKFMLISGYLLTPLFIFKLYYNLQLTLDKTALVAFTVGVVCLLIYSALRYNRSGNKGSV